MAEIAYIILIVAAVIGLMHIFRVLEHKILFGKETLKTISVIPLTGHVEDVELLVRKWMAQQRYCSQKGTTFVLVDAGMDCETRNICDRMSKQSAGILICDDCQIGNLLQRSAKGVS